MFCVVRLWRTTRVAHRATLALSNLLPLSLAVASVGNRKTPPTEVGGEVELCKDRLLAGFGFADAEAYCDADGLNDQHFHY